MFLSQNEIDRFKNKFVEGSKDECWEWRGAKYQNGYGMVSLRRGKRKTFMPHRISWSFYNNQEIPAGHMICHKCDNRICVNPNHLYLGTGFDNNKDTVIRNRGNRKIGEQCSWSKLSEENVLAILKSDEKQKLLAERYGVDQSMICQIKSGKRWNHVYLKSQLDIKTV